MSSSSKGGAHARDSGKADDSRPPVPDDEWQPTRAYRAPGGPSLEDEWAPTRALTGSPSAKPSLPDAWQATRAQTALATQLLKDEDDYLSTEKSDIGRQTGANERELFVSCDPAQAMQQQFEHLRPEFIAIHDVATASSRKLLLGIAAASGRALQKLVIRRQGYGTPLATLEFVELPTTDFRSLRLYTTEADADTQQRHALARTLLAFSRLGAIMVGDLPGHALASAIKPLHDDIVAGPWPNRNLLLLPLASASALVTHGMELGRGTGVTVRTTPQVARPADAWAFITGTWNRLREQSEPGASVPELGGFNPSLGAAVANARRQQAKGMPSGDTQPFDDAPVTLSMRPMPIIAGATGKTGAVRNLLERYVRQVGDLTGVVACCVFEIDSGRPIAHAGSSPAANDLGQRGMELLSAMTAGGRQLGFGQAVPEAAITLASHHLLLRPVPNHPGLALHAVLDKASANLTLARLQVLRMDTLFDEAEKA
ncbi:MAG TPA: hypothetical protein VMU47_18155 [Caldimonas sp.]|nr:hypothetical protein [Caldimonas sp.]